MEHLIRKKNRMEKMEKRTFSKTSATLAGQFSRVKVAKGYKLNRPRKVKIIL